ncbi:13810_t:CDS:2, partial [Racocetra fulgida]
RTVEEQEKFNGPINEQTKKKLEIKSLENKTLRDKVLKNVLYLFRGRQKEEKGVGKQNNGVKEAYLYC